MRLKVQRVGSGGVYLSAFHLVHWPMLAVAWSARGLPVNDGALGWEAGMVPQPEQVQPEDDDKENAPTNMMIAFEKRQEGLNRVCVGGG